MSRTNEVGAAPPPTRIELDREPLLSIGSSVDPYDGMMPGIPFLRSDMEHDSASQSRMIPI